VGRKRRPGIPLIEYGFFLSGCGYMVDSTPPRAWTSGCWRGFGARRAAPRRLRFFADASDRGQGHPPL